MSSEEPIKQENNERTPEDEERIRNMIRALLFGLFAVVAWYGIIPLFISN